MKENYLIIKERLKKYEQEHLLKNYEELDSNQKEELLKDIQNIDFEQINKLYKEINEKQNKKDEKIEPMNYIVKEKLSEEEIKHYEKIGTKIIKNGEYAVVTMAGGQRNKIGT